MSNQSILQNILFTYHLVACGLAILNLFLKVSKYFFNIDL